MALHPSTGEPWLGGGTGGVSGPAVRTVALAQVHGGRALYGSRWSAWAACRRVTTHASCIAVGATLVAVGTESFRDPAAGARIAAELEARIPSNFHESGAGSLKRTSVECEQTCPAA